MYNNSILSTQRGSLKSKSKECVVSIKFLKYYELTDGVWKRQKANKIGK